MEYLSLNPVQTALHDALEQQLREEGRVRAIILKARQMGVSTYLAARFFRGLHLSSAQQPLRCLVMAQDDATAKLLKRMYSTFWEMHPESTRRERVRSNDHEEGLVNGSLLQVRTASTTTGLRGGTISRLHCSEVAYWDHAEEHTLGAMNQLSKLPGSEMVLESTAAGATGAWYERWRAAQADESEFLPLFFPWVMLPEYRTPPPPGFTLSDDAPNDLVPSERDYAERHGCTLAQMYWRRREIVRASQDGQDGALAFAREYPASPEEAFLTGNDDSFCSPTLVESARRRAPTDGVQLGRPLVLGVDPAPAHGRSSTAVVWRRGKICLRIERWRGLTPEQLRNRLYDVAMRDRAARVSIDETEGVGHYLVTSLPDLSGMRGKVHGVRFGNAAQDRSRYANVRAFIWSKMSEWLPDACIPDEPYKPGQATLASELLAPRRMLDEKRVLLESKKQMATRGIASPDGADALACTFALPEPDALAGHGSTVLPGPFGGGTIRAPMQRMRR